jgi:hypothetical protein
MNYTWGNRPKSPAGEKENNKPRQWGGGKKTANQALKLGFEKLPGSKKYAGFGLKNGHPSKDGARNMEHWGQSNL